MNGSSAFIEHRVADRRVVRLIQKWLNAGVLEEGRRIESQVGTVQGGSIWPLLANVYLHYVFDLWAHRWRQRQAHGDVVVVRFADDFVVGFEHRDDAEQFLAELRARFARFGLTLHPGQDAPHRVWPLRGAEPTGPWGEASRTASTSWASRIAARRPGRERSRFLRRTMRTRMQAKLKAVKAELRRRMHHPLPELGAYVRSVVMGTCPLLRRPHEYAAALRVCPRGDAAVVAGAGPPQPAPPAVVSDATLRRPMDSAGPHLSSVSARAVWRRHPRWEPDAVTLHVRICGGGGGQPPSLLR